MARVGTAVLVAFAAVSAPVSGLRHGASPPLLHAAKTSIPVANAAIGHNILQNASINASHNASLNASNKASLNASHTASLSASHNASLNATGFDPNQPAAVGKVTALYYSQTTGTQAQTISATAYQAAAREPPVFRGYGALPEPSCPLQVTTRLSYKTENRKVNQRLASMAVCDYINGWRMDDLPSCNAGPTQVCELMVDLPMPNSDDHQEPYIGAAMALAAYSKLCSLMPGMHDYNCQVHRSGSAVLAGLVPTSDGVKLMGFDVAGILSTELYDAYQLYFDYVYLAQDRRNSYEETNFYLKQHDVLHWQHEPPQIQFCGNLACLVGEFINHNR